MNDKEEFPIFIDEDKELPTFDDDEEITVFNSEKERIEFLKGRYGDFEQNTPTQTVEPKAVEPEKVIEKPAPNPNEVFKQQIIDGDIDGIKTSINNGLDLSRIGFHTANFSPIHVAVESNQLEVAKYLIEQGQDVNKQDYDGTTPLYTAVNNDNVEGVRLLLENGANPDIIKMSGDSAFLLAAAKENPHPYIISDLIDHTKKINQRDNNGHTVLHQLARLDSSYTPDLIKKMVDHGADVNQKSIRDVSPLHVACDVGNPKAVEALVQNGANINEYNRKDMAPLHICCEKGDFHSASILVQYGADVNQGVDEVKVPVHYACISRNNDCVELLLNKGASREEPDRLSQRFGYGDLKRYLEKRDLHEKMTAELNKPKISNELMDKLNNSVKDYDYDRPKLTQNIKIKI